MIKKAKEHTRLELIPVSVAMKQLGIFLPLPPPDGMLVHPWEIPSITM